MNSSHRKKHFNKPISHLNELVSIEEVWRDIYNTVHPNSIFISFDYIMLWYKSFAKPDQVRVYRIYENDKIIGFLPLILYKKGPIRFLSSLTNLHCPHPAALIAGGYEEIFAKNCLDAIFSDKNGWDILTYQAYSFQPDYNLQNYCEKAYYTKQYIKPTYSILISDTFENYLNRDLSSKMRRTYKNEKNRLSKASSHSFTHYAGQEAVAAWPTFLLIEGSGWKGTGASSINKLSENYRSYYSGLIDLLCKNNKLHMYFLNIDSQPIAGVFCYEDQDMFHALKSGYLEEFSYFSPSNLLMLHIIEDLITNFPEIKRFHLFPGDFGYKHRYINEETFFLELFLFNKTILGSTICTFDIFKKEMKLIPGMPGVIRFMRNIFIKETD
jgi:CelD/BcsL family acetyltransferase involved in cellulose biosynthesis